MLSIILPVSSNIFSSYICYHVFDRVKEDMLWSITPTSRSITPKHVLEVGVNDTDSSLADQDSLPGRHDDCLGS